MHGKHNISAYIPKSTSPLGIKLAFLAQNVFGLGYGYGFAGQLSFSIWVKKVVYCVFRCTSSVWRECVPLVICLKKIGIYDNIAMTGFHR